MDDNLDIRDQPITLLLSLFLLFSVCYKHYD